MLPEECDGVKFLSSLLAWADFSDELPLKRSFTKNNVDFDSPDARRLVSLVESDRPPMVSLRVVVAKWFDEVTNLAPPSWPVMYKIIQRRIDERKILPEEICDAVGVKHSFDIERLFRSRGVTLPAGHERTKAVERFIANRRLIEFGNLRDDTPHGQSRRLVYDCRAPGLVNIEYRINHTGDTLFFILNQTESSPVPKAISILCDRLRSIGLRFKILDKRVTIW